MAAALYGAVPVAAVVTSPLVPWWVLGALALLTAVAARWPQAAPAVLLSVVPILPVVPSLVPAVPSAVVHLVVLSQAIPVLVRVALQRERPVGTVFTAGWALFLLVCVTSVGVELTPDRLRPAQLGDVWRDITAQVPAYVFVSHGTEDGRSLPWLIALTDGLLCAFIVGATVRRSSRSAILVAAACGALATAAFGFVQARTSLGLQSAWQLFDPGIVRINATFIDPNALAAYYALIGPVLLGLALGAPGRTRLGWGAGFVVVTAAMVMTAGRTGLLSLALACLLLGVLGLRLQLDTVDPWRFMRAHGRTLARRGLAFVVAVMCLLTAAGTLMNVSHAHQTSYLHTWLYTFNLRQPADAVAKGRLAVWQTVLAMVREAPVAGVGLGNAVNEFERYRDRLGIESLSVDARLSAHNTFLLVAGDLGLLGLTAWLLMMLTVLNGIRAPGNLPPAERATWPALGLVAGLAGYVATMLTGDRILLREDIVIGTTCAALACVGAPRLPGRLRLAMCVLALVVLASWPVRVAARSPVTSELPPAQGLHGEQIGSGGETYRWSTGYAVLFLPADARRVTVPVRNLSPNVQRVRVYVDGRPADERVLHSGSWVTLMYPLPPRSRVGRWRRLAIDVTPTWQAPGDSRVLGVVVGAVEIERPPPGAQLPSKPAREAY